MARAAKVYACALVSRGGRVLLVQEPQGQAVRWRFPTAPVPEGEDAGVALFRFLARDLALTPLGLEFVCTYPVMSGPMRERGLYHVFEVTGFRRQRASPAAPARWLTLAEIGQEDTSPVVAAVVGAATARRPRTRGPRAIMGAIARRKAGPCC